MKTDTVQITVEIECAPFAVEHTANLLAAILVEVERHGDSRVRLKRSDMQVVYGDGTIIPAGTLKPIGA